MGVQRRLILNLKKMVEKVEKAATKVSKPKKAVVASHPATSVMVKEAIENLKERKGSSLIAIKKYLATNYKVGPVKHGHFIKKALASGVEKKTIVQVKGIGASGSFKLAKVELNRRRLSNQRHLRKSLRRQRKRRFRRQSPRHLKRRPQRRKLRSPKQPSLQRSQRSPLQRRANPRRP